MGLDKQFETGVLWQDTQHQQLIELMEKLSNTREPDPKMFTYTTAFLAMYVNHHFNLEEQYMKVYGYPDQEFHVKEHQKFTGMIKQFRKEYPQFSVEGANFLEETISQWVKEHILENDQKLGKFVRKEEKKRILAQE